MSLPSIIAVDGPAGSGKSTISHQLAERYGYLFIDTGIFYRTMTLVALRAGIPFSNTDALTTLTENTHIDIISQNDDPTHPYAVFVEGEDVTNQIRTPQVEASVSALSAIGSVRAALVEQQRRIAAKGNIIMAGRDIGTVVLPHADVKLYIDASIQERARRRFQERVSQGQSANLAEIEAAMVQRDRVDSEREVSPLRQAKDAIYISTDNKSIEQVLGEIGEKLEIWQPA
ncbi:MAG: (d)CMP kinase [Chloroflexi bacterium]|nr:(d)CMP kinase [Chloroflexota bacterium]